MTDRAAEALFGRVRRELLALFFGHPDDDFFLRELARRIGASVGTVQPEVTSLAAVGLITRNPRGKHVYYQANRDSPLFDALRSLIEKTSGLADVVRLTLADLAADGRISIAFLYGSVAAGTHGPDSDVDLMIIGDVQLAELIPAIRDAQDRLGREIDPTTYSSSEFQARLKERGHFISRTLERPKIMLIGTEDDLGNMAGE